MLIGILAGFTVSCNTILIIVALLNPPSLSIYLSPSLSLSFSLPLSIFLSLFLPPPLYLSDISL